jgi:hypothetical protein
MGGTAQFHLVMGIAEKPDLDQGSRHLHAHQDDKGRLLYASGVPAPEPRQFPLDELGELARLVDVLGGDEIAEQGREGVYANRPWGSR